MINASIHTGSTIYRTPQRFTEHRDELGRSSGYTYAKNASVQQTVTTGYGSDGRISSAGFIHGGAQKMFGYTYLPGTHLLQTLTKPNNMSLTLSYETQRDLLTGMAYKRGSTTVASRAYTYDSLARPTARSTARNAQTVNDTFGYNSRSELMNATVNGALHGYDYDNIGNRTQAIEGQTSGLYAANCLNQYTSIHGYAGEEEYSFSPAFDADGNQTLVKTATGIWSVTYDAENRPVSFTNEETNTVMECSYDYMGRRVTKKVTVNGSITLHHRYLYRGYLQIACCDLTRSNHPALWLITWDPSQPIATRPLAIQKDATWYTYGWDLTKNICEVYGINGFIRTNYTYTPYGAVTTSGDVTQPIQWSSEFHDTELALVYYNYRHYNPTDGRWLGRDRAKRSNLYLYVSNKAIEKYDILGLFYILDLTHCGKKALQCSSINKNAGGNECCNPIERPKGVGIVFLNGDEADNSTFMKHAGANGRWLFTPQNGQELLRALEDVTNERCGNCIKNLTIAGHGHSTTDTQNGYPGENMEADEGFYYDSDYSDNILSANISDLSKLITENKIKFCKTCIIQLYGCRTGYSFASSFAKTTGCKVVFASGACSDKNNGDWNSGPGYWGEKSERDECFMGFVEAFPDGSFSKITNPGHNKDSNYTPK